MEHTDTFPIQKGNDSELTGKLGRQHLFLESLVVHKFNISASCRTCGIGRKTVYRWLKEDPQFKELYNEILAMRGDFIQEKLLQLVESGNVIAAIFCSKNWAGMSDEGLKDKDGPDADSLTTEQTDAVVKANDIANQSMAQYQREKRLHREFDNLKAMALAVKAENEELTTANAAYIKENAEIIHTNNDVIQANERFAKANRDLSFVNAKLLKQVAELQQIIKVKHQT